MAVISTSPNVTYLMCISYILFAVCSLTITVIDARSVPDGYVYTDQHRTARKGDQLELSCDFYRTPVGVFWKKGDNPEKSPDLITDVDGEPPSGSCVADQSCRLEADYTLIIDEVKVADQGTYICRVSNYRGVLIHNFTEVTVYAPPMEPFPVIKECPMKDPNDTQQTCSLSTSENVTITCSASGYYPDIDLFFLHGSRKMVTTDAEEVTNPDGTKNKSISTSAEPSRIPYVCVASDIPGSQDQRTMSIEVNYPEVIIHTTISSQTPEPSTGVAKIAVPVIFLLLVVLGVIVCWCLREKLKTICTHSSKDDPEAVPLNAHPEITGKISFYELWYLVQNMDKIDLKKLKDALHDLGISTDNVPTRIKAYELLCDWKDTDTSDNQGRRLYNTLFGYGLGGPWKRMTERRTGEEGVVISDWCLEHIVQQIGNETEFGKFLGELTRSQQLTSKGNRDEYVEEAMKQLKMWRGRIRDVNHFVLISLALESAKCKPLDRTFFKIPEHLLDPISSQEVKGFVYGLTGRHCRRIAEAVEINDEQKILTIINENNEELFDTQEMIIEWIDEQECSNYEKRCKLDDAVIKIGRHDLTDSFGTINFRIEAGDSVETAHLCSKSFNYGSIFDDDLAVLLKNLPHHAMPLFLEKLGISDDKSDCSPTEKLQCWRDDSIRHSRAIPLRKLCEIHRDALKETKYEEDHDVKDDELENILECITSVKQLEQLTGRLGIKHRQGLSHIGCLKQWRDKYAIEKRREAFTEALNAAGFPGCILDRLPTVYVYEAEMVRFAYHILCTDITPLATHLEMNTSRMKPVREPLKGTVGILIQLLTKSRGIVDKTRRRNFSLALRALGYVDVARSTHFAYGASLSELYTMTLGLSKDEMKKLIKYLEIDRYALAAAEQLDNLSVMKVWRNQLRPEPINFRLKLALGLRAVGKDKQADDIFAGRSRAIEIRVDVAEKIYYSLDDRQVAELYNHLKISVRKGSDDQTSAAPVIEWVREWLKKFDKFTFGELISADKLIPRGEKNDKIFRAGFFELAEEVMLLEISRLISDKSSNRKIGEMSYKGEGKVNPESMESAEAPSEDQGEPSFTKNSHGDGASGDQELGGPAKDDVEEATNMSDKRIPLVLSDNHFSANSNEGSEI